MDHAHRSTALVVENDEAQRTLVSLLLEESEMNVIECESAEAAVLVLEESGDTVTMVFTDVELAGMMDGIELAYIAKQRYPDMHVVVTSGAPRVRRLPDGTLFMAKPWSQSICCARRSSRFISVRESIVRVVAGTGSF